MVLGLWAKRALGSGSLGKEAHGPGSLGKEAYGPGSLGKEGLWVWVFGQRASGRQILSEQSRVLI